MYGAYRHTLTIGCCYLVVAVLEAGNKVTVIVDGEKFEMQRPEKVAFGSGGSGHGAAVAPLAGKIVQVLAQANSKVTKGYVYSFPPLHSVQYAEIQPRGSVISSTPLVIMEAMKLEHVIRAPHDCVVEKLLYNVGDFVEGTASSVCCDLAVVLPTVAL